MRKVLLVTAAIGVAVIFFAWAMLPPQPRNVTTTVDADVQRRTISGAYHVHSTRSDGAGDKNAIAEAASRAGLAFVILTDHGDGTRPPDPAEFLHGVLCLDAVEISTTGGHYVALDMKPAPYPLAGEPSAVVEDVHRMGGFGIAAHPDSPRGELAWSDWSAPIDGIEWLSADSEWRDESRAALARVSVGYLMRPGPALALMLDRPVATLRRWDALASTRPIVGLAAHDAHGGIGRGVEEGGARRAALSGIPSYEASFRTFSNRVILDAPLSGDAAAAARQVLDAIEHGRVFTVIDALATPGFLEFRDSDTNRVYQLGSVQGGVFSGLLHVSMPAGGRLFEVNGDQDAKTPQNQLADASRMNSPLPIHLKRGATRFEVRLPGAPGTPPVPWLVTNPVYVLPTPAPSVPPPADVEVRPLAADAAWHVEKDTASRADVTTTGGEVTFTFALRPGDRASQFAAVVTDLADAHERFERIRLTASAARPGRLSIQLRYPQKGGIRWGTSAYVDSTLRELLVPLDRMRPLDRQAGPAPDPATAVALLIVADLTNARPGDSNTIHFGSVRFAR
jgi:hypothetical protein